MVTHMTLTFDRMLYTAIEVVAIPGTLNPEIERPDDISEFHESPISGNRYPGE